MSEKSMADKLDEIQAWIKWAVPELELLNHKLTLMTADRDTLFSVHQEDEERIAALEKEKFELYEACRSMERELDSGILVTHELVQEVQDEVAKNPDVDMRVHMYAAINGLTRPNRGIKDKE